MLTNRFALRAFPPRRKEVQQVENAHLVIAIDVRGAGQDTQLDLEIAGRRGKVFPRFAKTFADQMIEYAPGARTPEIGPSGLPPSGSAPTVAVVERFRAARRNRCSRVP